MRFLILDKYAVLTACVALIAVLIVVFVSATETAPVLSENGENLPIYSVETDEKVVALTLNAAWDAHDIDEILNTLSAENVKCTFFAVGTWLEKYPEAAKKILAAGHELGSHSYDHAHFNKLSADEMRMDMEKCENILKALGSDCTLFRAPYGEYNETVVKTCRETNRFCIQWDVDSLDWKGLSQQEMTDRILPRLQNGSILLFHSGTEKTKDALPAIIRKIKEAGYSFKPVGELIYKEGYSINHEGRQMKSTERKF